MIRENLSVNSNIQPSTETELLAIGCTFEKLPDGTFIVKGSINLYNSGLSALPDLSAVHVTGNFICGRNSLKSLLGAPRSVDADFFCNDNHLTSLEHAPHAVGGSFYCDKTS